MESLSAKSSALELQSKVLQLLNWSEEEYSAFMYETGLCYLRSYFVNDEDAIDRLSRIKEFWNWFKLHWHARDQDFFESFTLDQCQSGYRVMMYKALHKPEALVEDIFPPRIVLGRNFHTAK